MSDQELDSSTSNKDYPVLKETADWLSRRQEPDIDKLVPRVERAMQAYRICRDRLDRVKETLGQYLQNDGQQGSENRPGPGVDGAVPMSRISSPVPVGDQDGSLCGTESDRAARLYR
jgi:exodeoxyribonuclease VII small subunit